MSSAHRPTYDPAMGRDTRLNTRQYSSRDLASHTKLKFRQPGQAAKGEVSRRDLRLELEQAEQEAKDKKRKASGAIGFGQDDPPPSKKLAIENNKGKRVEGKNGDDDEDDERAKRRKVLEQAAELDKDDSDDDEGGANSGGSDDSDSDSDDDEDDTAELLRELEKIKRERAEDKERQERERAEGEQQTQEEAVATGNPLLNLQAALSGNASAGPSSSLSDSFQVKRRWDDDVIFKNQARDVNENSKREFINDLLRTEFHKKFLKKYIA